MIRWHRDGSFSYVSVDSDKDLLAIFCWASVSAALCYISPPLGLIHCIATWMFYLMAFERKGNA